MLKTRLIMDNETHETVERTLAVARGDVPADLSIRGGTLLNVLSGRLERTDVAVSGSVVAGLGDYRGETELDASGLIVCPSFWDGHLHLESSMLMPSEFARVAVPAGTGAVVLDPHEIANVRGVEGIRFLLDASEGLPLDFFFMLPSCVPATNMETAGAELTAADLLTLGDHPRVLGLAEVMNFPGVIAGAPDVLEKIRAFSGRIVDGHAPLVAGKPLNAYIGTGIGSDHECTTREEAEEKLSRGMRIMIRQGTLARNMRDLLPLVTPYNERRTLLVTDDRTAVHLATRGHMNDVLAEAVSLGLDPVTAVRMVTLNTAEYFGFRKRGAVAPGFRADIVLLEDLSRFAARTVIKRGKIVCRDGCLEAFPPAADAAGMRSTVRLPEMREDVFLIPAEGKCVRVIGVIPGQIITEHRVLDATIRDGRAVADPERDVAKIAVVERHKSTGNVGLGFVQGLGLRDGAICSSVAHDSHNLVVAGSNDADMMAAVRAVADMQGGQAVVRNGKVLAVLPLPVAGLISTLPADRLIASQRELLRAVGYPEVCREDPFIALSFLALPVIPALKITDKGLVDVNRFDFVSLFADRISAQP